MFASYTSKLIKKKNVYMMTRTHSIHQSGSVTQPLHLPSFCAIYLNGISFNKCRYYDMNKEGDVECDYPAASFTCFSIVVLGSTTSKRKEYVP